MPNDSNLLKEAIADAKAVRRTAMLNAKVALEEAFSERYQKMFAEKLKEDTAMDETHPAEEGGMKSAEETVSEQEIDELIKELEAEVGGEQPATEPPAVPGAAPMAPPMGAEQGAVQGAIPGTTVAPVPPTMPAAPGVAPVPPAGAPPVPGAAASPPPSDVPPAPGAEEEEEDVNLDELLESLKEEIEEEGKEEGNKLDEVTKLQSSGIGGSKAGGSDNKKPTSASSSTSKIENAANDDEGMAAIDQPKVTAKEATQASRPNKGSHVTKDNLSTPSLGKGGDTSGGQTETGMDNIGQPKVTSKEPTNARRPNEGSHATKTNLSTPGGMLDENTSLKKKLGEAYETITYVKGQLNEINLLNAKLLYTNKLFKEFSMSNEQKMRIVEMFDLSKNIREVKLTFTNIVESLNFSGVDMKRKPQTSTSVQSITEGLSSKPVGSTKPTRGIITESQSAMVSKFQKLAGIQKK
jgi:hypothetical protein